MFENIPWSVVLPGLVLGGFFVGTFWKRGQDRAVHFVKTTLRPGDLHVDDLEAYAKQLDGAA